MRLASVPVPARTTSAQFASAAFERRQLRFVGALLRAVDGGRTVRPEQRIVDVAGEYEVGAGDGGMQVGQVESHRVEQRRAATPDVLTRRVEHPRTERLQHAGATVGGGAAAEPDDDLVGAVVEGVGDHLAEAECACAEGIQPTLGQRDQPGSRGEFHHRGLPVHRVVRLVQLTGRPVDGKCDRLPTGGHERGHGAVAAVGDRHPHDLPIRMPGRQPVGERVRDLLRTQRTLELVRGDNDAHVQHSARPHG